MEALRPVLEKCGQQHLLDGYEALSPEEQAELLQQLQVGGLAALPAGRLSLSEGRACRQQRYTHAASLPATPTPRTGG